MNKKTVNTQPEKLKERLKEMRRSNKMTLKCVAEHLDIKEATMQRIESGGIKNVKYDYIKKLSALYGCSPTYLMGWSDLKNSPYNVGNSEELAPFDGTLELGKKNLEEGAESFKADYTFIMPDDTMTGARIKKGDTLFINTSYEVSNGGIYLLQYRDAKIVRRAFKNDDCIIFQADGSLEPPIVMSGMDDAEPVIFGKVTAFLSITE